MSKKPDIPYNHGNKKSNHEEDKAMTKKVIKDKAAAASSIKLDAHHSQRFENSMLDALAMELFKKPYKDDETKEGTRNHIRALAKDHGAYSKIELSFLVMQEIVPKATRRYLEKNYTAE